MLVLLPPSETKTSPQPGKPLDLATLSFPEITATREQILAALIDLARRYPAKSLEILGISARQSDEVARNAELDVSPTAAAGRVYTGVLYDSLDVATLNAAALRRANKTLIVSSALFGAVRFGDRIPAYRLSGDTTLPGIGTITGVWRDPLALAMSTAARSGLIVDLRSGTYASMWKATGEVADRTVTVRVLQQMPDGSRKVVSHFNKATKGRLVRRWLIDGVSARDADELAHSCESEGIVAELAASPKRGQPRLLDVVVSDL
ncbi:MAG: peroxide stress protein YaaA [Actinomycetes bacterium]